MPLVSILVPVYNVERYLSRCLDSLVAQTYKDIEIIIINDGSTDNSRDIALLYSKRFNNIYVYDYENAGISTTRNRALDKAHGDYVMFVDSDDFLARRAIEKMMDVVQREHCDIVACGYVMDFGLFPLFRKVVPKKTMTSLEALHNMVSNKGVNNYPWAKLFSKKCFDNVRFPSGTRGFEDTRTIFKAFHNAKKVCTIPNRYYHYVQRRGSLTNHMDLDTVYDMRKAYEYQEAYLHKLYPDEKFSFDSNYYNSDMVILYTLIFFYSKKDNPVYIPANIDWKKINPILCVAYRIWLSIARFKLGWSYDRQLENKQ